MLRRPLVVLAALAVFLVTPAGAFAAVPRRIVSLSPTATESLFAIGAGRQVVAVDWMTTRIPSARSPAAVSPGSNSSTTRSGW